MTLSALSTLVRSGGIALSTAPISGTADVIGNGNGNAAAAAASDDAKVHHSNGRGRMHRAVEDAFQSLGLSMPATGTSPASASPSGTTSPSSASPSAGNVQHDMHQFMHALYQAVRTESSPSTSSDAAAAKAARAGTSSSFSDGLSALIAKTANGAAPSGLQDAFNRLAGDLQGSQGAPVAVDPSAPPMNSATGPSLQDLLTRLQQDLGYGPAKTTSTGNTVSTQV